MILLIKNGHVINPATETDEVADILAEDGKVVKMEKNIKAKADRVIDAKGCINNKWYATITHFFCLYNKFFSYIFPFCNSC